MARSRAPMVILVGAALALSACSTGSNEAPTADPAAIPDSILAVMDRPEYQQGTWGLVAIDVASGETVLSLNPSELLLSASVMKIWSVTTTLAELGPDHRFTTPVFATGPVVDGALDGDLVLVASGDLTLNGRSPDPDTIDVPLFDHLDANALPGLATLSPEDPLAGLDDLAAQVAAAGITRVDGDVLIDASLWVQYEASGQPVSPIVVNDNVVDFLVTPGSAVGEPATVEWRPHTAQYAPEWAVTTGPADSEIALELSGDETEAQPQAGALRPPAELQLTGSVPLGAEPVVWTYVVPDPVRWARTLFIEALERAGVDVVAEAMAAPAGLPALDPDAVPIASIVSPPFSETARLINKVSHNLGAGMLPGLLAAHRGETTVEAGIAIERELLEAGGVDPDSIYVTAENGLIGNRITPQAQAEYLVHLTGTPTFDVFFDSMPVLGVDGSLSGVLPDGDPAIGHASAKTGTAFEVLDDNSLTLDAKVLAGYVDTAGGRRLAFGLFLNGVPVDDIAVYYQVNADLAAIVSQLYQLY